MAYESLRQASKIKELKNSRTQQSLDRITKLKEENLSNYKPIYIPEIKSKIGSAQNFSYQKNLEEKIVNI